MRRIAAVELEVFKRQLLLAPRQVRVRMLEHLESLLAEMVPGRAYPLDYVTYRVTGHRVWETTDLALPAEEASPVLARILEEVARTVTVEAESIDELVLTVDDLCRRWNLAPQVVMRMRKAGLAGRLFRFGRGRRRIGVRESLVLRFEADHARTIRRARTRRLLGLEERRVIVEAAVVALAREESPSKVVAALAEKFDVDRAPLERMLASQARDNAALRPLRRASISRADREEICRQLCVGRSLESVAARFGRSPEMTRRIWLRGRVKAALRRKLKVVPNDDFSAPDAWERIIGAPAPREECASSAAPEELPLYLRDAPSLPVLTREEEIDLFRSYNFLKSVAAKLRKDLDARRVDLSLLERVEALLHDADAVRNRLVSSNLRLVLAIAKRHFGRKTSFAAIVSDGNMALIDAVESFDYGRGNRFSTYAGWAIVRRFARTIPEDNYAIVSLDPEILESAASVEIDFTAVKPAAVAAGVARALDQLPERERIVIESRFGLGSHDAPSTLAEVGALFGVTKERIRQIEFQALKRLRKIVEAAHPELMPE